MGILNNLMTCILLLVWFIFLVPVETSEPRKRLDQDDEKTVDEIKRQVNFIKIEKYRVGQNIIDGIWNAKSKETRVLLSKMLVDLLSQVGED